MSEVETVGREASTYWHKRTVLAELVIDKLITQLSETYPELGQGLYTLAKSWDDAINNLDIEYRDEPEKKS